MPIYNYRCKKCGAAVERIVKFDERDVQRCEEPKNNDGEFTATCDGELEREEIAVVSKMGHQWKP